MNRSNPDHIFLSLRGSNELLVRNIAFLSTTEELKEKIPAMWPAGATSEATQTEWKIRFSGSPWSATGQDAVLAQRIIIRVFWILSNQGYVYLTSINTGNAFKPTQLVFIRARSDPEAVFFTMTVNPRGDQVRFVDLPRGLADQIGIPLRYQFPHFVQDDKAIEDGGYCISLSETLSSGAVNKNLFLAAILKALNDLAFKLDASVPMSRTGLLGLGSRKEVWVFKGSPSWWPGTGREQ